MAATGARLLRTPRAQQWLAQFDLREQPAAELLVCSLVLVPQDELDVTLAGLIRRRRDEVRERPLRDGESPAPIALYGIREVERFCEVAEPGRRPTPAATVLAKSEMTKPQRRAIGRTFLPVYFENCRPDARAFPVGHRVGSEGPVAYLTNRLARETWKAPDGYLDHPPLGTVRERRCRDVFLIDDLIGSSDRTAGFVPAFARHPTVASWLRGRFLRLSVISYAATRWGEERVSRCGVPVHSVCYEHPVLSGRHWWPADRRQAVIDLCRRYAGRTSRPNMPLGYDAEDDARGPCCMVFSYKCPNNAPAILWAGRPAEEGDPGWLALFPQLPADDGLGACFHDGGADARRSVLLAVLSAIQSGSRRAEEVNRRTELGLIRTSSVLAWCAENGLVTARFQLTRAGRREMRHLMRLETPPEGRNLVAAAERYY